MHERGTGSPRARRPAGGSGGELAPSQGRGDTAVVAGGRRAPVRVPCVAPYIHVEYVLVMLRPVLVGPASGASIPDVQKPKRLTRIGGRAASEWSSPLELRKACDPKLSTSSQLRPPLQQTQSPPAPPTAHA
eukprot:7388083-Prymnesium_polylepis.2